KMRLGDGEFPENIDHKRLNLVLHRLPSDGIARLFQAQRFALAWLALHRHVNAVGLIPFINKRLLRCSTDLLLIGIFRRVTITANYFLACLNSHQPFLFVFIPGGFYTICSHHPHLGTAIYTAML
ncbi:MAG: hypothetical protein DMG61_16950, partial [Acidobacteria bacterium]